MKRMPMWNVSKSCVDVSPDKKWGLVKLVDHGSGGELQSRCEDEFDLIYLYRRDTPDFMPVLEDHHHLGATASVSWVEDQPAKLRVVSPAHSLEVEDEEEGEGEEGEFEWVAGSDEELRSVCSELGIPDVLIEFICDYLGTFSSLEPRCPC